MSLETTIANRMYMAHFLTMYGATEGGEDLSLYPVLSDLDDLDPIPGELGMPSDGGGLVTLGDTDELQLALEIAANRLSFYNDHATIVDKVQHESEHAAAAVALGLIATHAVRFKRLENGNVGMKVTTIPSGKTITKLGFASAIAHPQRLSNGDVRKIQIIGYENAEDIAGRIQDHEVDFPLPLSLR